MPRKEYPFINANNVWCGNCEEMKGQRPRRCYRDTLLRESIGITSTGCGNFNNKYKSGGK